eukprot:COSAG06_NODE_1004_length_11128_cov_5.572944_7_plen_116_part_00
MNTCARTAAAVNTGADDGLTMLPDSSGAPVAARSLLRSWKAVVPRIAEALHEAKNPPDGSGMVLWINPDMGHRIDSEHAHSAVASSILTAFTPRWHGRMRRYRKYVSRLSLQLLR